jgi:simple sugar transport system permease protein
MPDGTAPLAKAGPGWRRPRFVLAVRENPSPWLRGAVLAAAVLAGVALSAAVLILAGVPGEDLADEFIVNTLSSPDNLRAILAQAAPLMLVGGGAALAFRPARCYG